ncbi:MAG TPA: hypothetical protein VH137_05945, partial [Gemmatimonadales bacterium]|nr:hypothetical protein [Gemmatimonadales bacterium]
RSLERRALPERTRRAAGDSGGVRRHNEGAGLRGLLYEWRPSQSVYAERAGGSGEQGAAGNRYVRHRQSALPL